MQRSIRAARRMSVVLGILLSLSLVSMSSASAYTVNAMEYNIGWQANHLDRIPRGLVGLHLNNNFSYIAHQHSVAMQQRGYIYHTSKLTSYVTGSSWRTLGENVAVGKSLSGINTALMNSPGHRANILCRCFTQFGLGVVKDSRGYYWVTQFFYG